uniref:Uncharacterized protein n=1 Tax=uncultured marine virus TaxID=186617 RepID=A0A0F7L2Z6_9VIRU|nr:hypothetical protein [uncultured marine virus]
MIPLATTKKKAMRNWSLIFIRLLAVWRLTSKTWSLLRISLHLLRWRYSRRQSRALRGLKGRKAKRLHR